MLKSIDPTQTEHIRRRLEEQISVGFFKPGERVHEAKIAMMFGTSRTPVREAVMQLVAAGLLEKQPRRGAVVASLDIERMLQLFDFASELAGLCAKYAARRMLDTDRSGLEELHANMSSMAEAEDYAGVAKANAQFHLLIIQACHNDYFIESMLNIAAKLASYYRYELTIPGKIPQHLDQHRAIVDAINARDAGMCAELMRHHAMIEPEIIGDFLALQKALRNQRHAHKIDPILGRELEPENLVRTPTKNSVEP